VTGSDPSRLPLTGGCLCGGVRYEVAEPLPRAGYCHCTRCQRLTSTGASANARAVPGSVRWVAGEEHIRVWWPKDGWGKGFCTICGSSVFSQDRDNPELLSIRLGSFDHDPGVRPSARHHVGTAVRWECVLAMRARSWSSSR
jgi:hypothetical protein